MKYRFSKEELRKRKWPVPSFPIPPEVGGGEYLDKYRKLPRPRNYAQSAFIPPEQVKAYPLFERGRKSMVPGEMAITSLEVDADGNIFGATSGEKSYLFKFSNTDKKVVPIIEIDEKCGVTDSLVVSSGGVIWGATTKPDGAIFRYDLNSSEPKLERLKILEDQEGIGCLKFDEKSNSLFGVTTPSGMFFAFNLKTGEIEFQSRGDEHGPGAFSESLALSPEQRCVYGARRWAPIRYSISKRGDIHVEEERWANMFKYDIEEKKIIDLGVKIPFIPGKKIYARLDAMIYSRKERVFYGGERSDGLLFKYDPDSNEVICLGKPTPYPFIRGLTEGKNGIIYGISGRKLCHLFKYNPENRELKDLGEVCASEPHPWVVYELDAMATGKDGKIILGESDRISHLFELNPL